MIEDYFRRAIEHWEIGSIIAFAVAALVLGIIGGISLDTDVETSPTLVVVLAMASLLWFITLPIIGLFCLMVLGYLVGMLWKHWWKHWGGIK